MGDMLYFFTANQTPGLTEVGGKGLSLIEMTRAGLQVPQGFILIKGFFGCWIAKLQATPEWSAFLAAVRADKLSDEELKKCTVDLVAACEGLTFTEEQEQQLSKALLDLHSLSSDSVTDGSSGTGLLAVRSSSPQEDLEGASFAGVYESVLGVPPEKILEAVRTVFSSSMSFKAISYKRQRGFDPVRVEIAVIIQEQIASESAGVAFSLNPQNNDYDEAVIQANWGLGETVVSGHVTPDRFIVDKSARRIIEKKCGTNEISLWCRPEGDFIKEQKNLDKNGRKFALTDEQVLEILQMIERVEAVAAVPVDVEWAFSSDGKLYLLQVRPVTTYFPLPDELLTAPDAPRRLYADSTLFEEGLQVPLSVLGSRWMEDALVEMIRQATGWRIPTRESDGFILTVGGRWYMNVSNVLWFGRERLAKSLESLDFHTAQIMRNVDVERYKKAARKSTVPSIVGMALGAVVHSAGVVVKTLVGLTKPERARRCYEAAVNRYRLQLAEAAHTACLLPELGEGIIKPAVHLLINEGMPLTYAAESAKSLIRSLYKRSQSKQQLLEMAFRSMPHNITIEMGITMYGLARLLADAMGEESFADLPALARKIKARELPEQFMREWDAFMQEYGFRGPDELDLASPRYVDDPILVLEQMRQYVLLDKLAEEPQQAYERRQRERCEAYRELLDRTRNPVKAWLVQKLYRTAEAFSGFREIHKYYLVMAGYEVRKHALEVGLSLVEHGRLESVEQVFDLNYENLQSDPEDPELDLRACAHRNSSYRRKVAQTPGVRFPAIVDSRGRIPSPATKDAGPGVLLGEGISAGVASGPAKVLSYVGEKPVLPGGILVARATDPGWTPLFVNAAGIVLETGGSFQHGALVAREYGKPCIVGIDEATMRISDGDMVKIDGEAGTLTFISGGIGNEG